MKNSSSLKSYLSPLKVIKLLNSLEISVLRKEGFNFEKRAVQEKMLEGVVKMFNHNLIYLCEAPTGTGKSLAYLLPAFIWAQKKKEKIVISTYTIHLQEQLLNKDIKLVNQIFPNSLKVSLVKGKNNFLCYKKVIKYSSRERNLFLSVEEKKKVDKILHWSKHTQWGDKSELDFYPPKHIWREFSCEHEYCRVQQCEFKEKCFQVKNRKKVNQATILLVNHNLLCADLKIKNQANDLAEVAVLPNFKTLIVDEVHHLEKVVTVHFTEGVNFYSLHKIFNYLFSFSKKGQLQGGLFKRLELNLKLKKIMKTVWTNQLTVIYDQLKSFFLLLNSQEKLIYSFLLKVQQFSFYNNKANVSYDESFFKHKHYQTNFKKPLATINESLQSVLEELKKVFLKLNQPYPISSSSKWFLSEISIQLKKLKDSINLFYAFLQRDSEKENQVRWINLEKKGNNLVVCDFCLSPLVASKILKTFFSQLKRGLLTSATLVLKKGDFSFMLDQLGLQKMFSPKLFLENLPTCFDYKENCKMVIPRHFPAIQDKSFLLQSVELIKEVLSVLKGKTLILFTAQKQLLAFKKSLVELEVIKKKEIVLLTQGDASQFKIVEYVRKKPNYLLLGLTTFWSGIDISGKNLSVIIMVKLPFQLPEEPLAKSRADDFKRKKLNPFNHFFLPQAIIQFKQGFGRLIRSYQDKGVFIVLDNRILNKPYGKSFIQALPPMERIEMVDKKDLTNALQLCLVK